MRSGGLRLGGAGPADAFAWPARPSRDLNADHDQKGDTRGGREPAPGIVLEGTPAQVPESGGERGPQKRGDRGCEYEASLSHSRETGSERHGRPAAGDEA